MTPIPLAPYGDPNPNNFPNATLYMKWSYPNEFYPGVLFSPTPNSTDVNSYLRSKIDLALVGEGYPGKTSCPPVALPGWIWPDRDFVGSFEIIPLSGSIITRDNILLNYKPINGTNSSLPMRWADDTGSLKFYNQAYADEGIEWPTPEYRRNPNQAWRSYADIYFVNHGTQPLYFRIAGRFTVPRWYQNNNYNQPVAVNYTYTNSLTSREYMLVNSNQPSAESITLEKLKSAAAVPSFSIQWTYPHSKKPYKIQRRDTIKGANDSRKVILKIINTRAIPSGAQFKIRIIPVTNNITAADFANLNKLEWNVTVSGTGNGVRHTSNIIAGGKIKKAVEKFKIRVSYDPGPNYSGPISIETPVYSIVKNF